jgi:uncharacterized protein (TIGR02594 family)
MPEYEELKLVVSLTDNASAQLDKLKSSLKDLGGGGTGAGMERMKKDASELSALAKTLAESLGGSGKAAATLTNIFSTATLTITAMGAAIAGEIALMKKYADEMARLGAMVRQTGLNAAEIKSMSETMRMSGLSAEQATRNISGLANAMADFSRQNSELRRNLMARAGPGGSRGAMEALFGDLAQVIDNPGAFVNRLKDAQDNIIRNALAAGKSRMEAARAGREFGEAWGMPDLANMRRQFEPITDEQKKLWAERTKAAEDFNEQVSRIAISWERVNTTMQASILPKMTSDLRAVADLFERIAGYVEKAAGWLKSLGHFLPTSVKEGLEMAITPGPLAYEKMKQIQERHKNEPDWKPYTPPPRPVGNTVNTLGLLDPGQGGGSWYDELMARGRRSTNIEDRRNEARQTLDERNDQMKDLVAELKALNQNLTDIFGLGGGAGAPGGGGGGGARGLGILAPGGGFSAGAGTGGGGGGAAPGYGGGAQPYGSDTGGKTGTGASGPAGDPAVPSAILAQAQQVALTGGPGAVEKFMASQGYPKAGNWCGEFAASVVKSVGGTPPKDPAIASNWRNYGVAVDTPQPGDIAVRRGPRTGSTGGHVTFVENVDPKTGRFTGLGGNQGAGPESSFRTSQYEFRRPAAAFADAGDQMSPLARDAGLADLNRIDRAMGGRGADAGAGGRGGAAHLAQQRQRIADELKAKPWLKDWMSDVIQHESDNPEGARAVAEAAVNRAIMTGKSLEEITSKHGRFYGPVNRGQVTGTNLTKWAKNLGENAMSDVLGGSNVTRGATDQGMRQEIHGPFAEKVGGEWFGDYGGRASRWRAKQQADVAAADRAALDRDMGKEVSHKVEGTGKLTVDVNAPAGTKVGAEGGGIFKKTETNRQTQMEPARTGPSMAEMAPQGA